MGARGAPPPSLRPQIQHARTTVRGVALDVIMQVGGERAGGRDPLPLTKSCRPHGWCLRYGTLTYMHQAEEAEAKKSQLIGAVLFGIANQTSAQQATLIIDLTMDTIVTSSSPLAVLQHVRNASTVPGTTQPPTFIFLLPHVPLACCHTLKLSFTVLGGGAGWVLNGTAAGGRPPLLVGLFGAAAAVAGGEWKARRRVKGGNRSIDWSSRRRRSSKQQQEAVHWVAAARSTRSSKRRARWPDRRGSAQPTSTCLHSNNATAYY